MCFSASASFGASALLAIAGVATLRKVTTPTQIPFAAIPLIFAFHQFVEGVVWLSLTHAYAAPWENGSTTAFLLLAQVLWPFWIPFSIYLIEPEKTRKAVLRILAFAGAAVGLLLAYRVLFHPVAAVMTPYHIRYVLSFPYKEFTVVISIFYFLVTIVPPFFASNKRVIILGFLNLTSFIVTVIFFEQYVISVWCFFAGLMSWEVYLGMKAMRPQAAASVVTV